MDYHFHVVSPGSVYSSCNRYFVPSYLDRSDQLGPTTSTSTTLRLHPIPSLYFCSPQGIMNYRDCGSSGSGGDDTGMSDSNQVDRRLGGAPPETRMVTSWTLESEAPSSAAGARQRVVGSHQLNNARKRQRLEAAIALLKMERPRRNSTFPIEVPWEQPHEQPHIYLPP